MIDRDFGEPPGFFEGFVELIREAPLAFQLAFGLITALILYVIVTGVVKGTMQWSRNNASPVLTGRATVVGKRTSMSGGGDTSVSTWYHVTFEVEDGSRTEFQVDSTEYGLLAEGDTGTMTHQGTRFKGFTRAPADARPGLPVIDPARPADARRDDPELPGPPPYDPDR